MTKPEKADTVTISREEYEKLLAYRKCFKEQDAEISSIRSELKALLARSRLVDDGFEAAQAQIQDLRAVGEATHGFRRPPSEN